MMRNLFGRPKMRTPSWKCILGLKYKNTREKEVMPGMSFSATNKRSTLSVADPGFSWGGAPTPKLVLFCKFFAENCMKMKEFGPGGASPPPLGSANGYCITALFKWRIVDLVSVLQFLPAATKLGQGNIFTLVCDSVNGGGTWFGPGGVPGLVWGGYLVWSGGEYLADLPPGADTPPPGPDTPPQEQTPHPPGPDTPPGPDLPGTRHPPRSRPPGPDTHQTTRPP